MFWWVLVCSNLISYEALSLKLDKLLAESEAQTAA